MAKAGLDPDLIEASIADARERKADALAEYEKASAELAWWIKGAELAGVAVTPEDDVQPNVEELFPPASYFDETGTQPTLRQGIIAHLRENPTMALPVADISRALILRGWLDEDREPAKRVSDLAGVMHAEEQLQRVDRGVYRLHPRIALALEQRAFRAFVRADQEAWPASPVSLGDQE